MRVAVIGGGAAGVFAALSCAKHHPDAEVTIIERSAKMLSKVKVSGGGRCNVTTSITAIPLLLNNYPRGAKLLKPLFYQFGPTNTVAWFAERDVPLHTEADGRMFPTTNDSQTIIDCLLFEAQRHHVQIRTLTSVKAIRPEGDGFQLLIGDREERYDRIIVTTGGHAKREAFDWLANLGHDIVDPVPSLFTFNLPEDPIRNLSGVSVPHAIVRLTGTKLVASGPLLITHWGLSGPAVLRLSAFGARILAEREYISTVQVNWTGIANEEELRNQLNEYRKLHPKALVHGRNPFGLPARLWEHLCALALELQSTFWGELGAKPANRLINYLVNDEHQLQGKTTFKDEFVTCGGVDTGSIHPDTLQSRSCPGLYFAGEVLDVDGVTGGFNFQAAWTTGFVAGRLGGLG